MYVNCKLGIIQYIITVYFYALQRLWMKTNLKLAKLLLDRNENTQLNQVLRDLKQSCKGKSSYDAQARDNHLLEIYALEIQLLTREKKNKKLKVINSNHYNRYIYRPMLIIRITMT
jgi:hypothetical protein